MLKKLVSLFLSLARLIGRVLVLPITLLMFILIRSVANAHKIDQDLNGLQKKLRKK